jgi:UDP-glucose:(heptosyl)LPS alpha-1,3-glucosyltransferase
VTDTGPIRIGIDIRTADAPEPGQQRMLWRLGGWLGSRTHDVHLLTLREQREGLETPDHVSLHRLHDLGHADLVRYVGDLELDALLLNPERARRYRGLPANVLRSGYGTEHYVQKLRSFRRGPERALRAALRTNPWDALERRWERDFYEGTDPAPDVVAQSHYMKEQILQSYDIAPERIHVVYNGVDTAEYSVAARESLRGEMRARWSIPDDAFCLLLIGHNFRLKGLWDLLEVLASHRSCRDVHLLVAGRGTGRTQRAQASKRVDQLGLSARVTLAGPVQPALHAHAAADALVHLSWHDSFGFVVLEAMACGLPVITTPFVGAAELIEDGTSGLIVDPAGHHAIASAIELLRDPTSRQRMGAAAAEVGRAHDEPACFDAVSRILQHAADRRGAPIRA